MVVAAAALFVVALVVVAGAAAAPRPLVHWLHVRHRLEQGRRTKKVGWGIQ